MSNEDLKAKINDEKAFSKIVDIAFDAADTDKSGFVERKELKEVMTQAFKQFGAPSPPSDADIDEELKKLDKNKDGKISKEEFRVLIKDILIVMIELLS